MNPYCPDHVKEAARRGICVKIIDASGGLFELSSAAAGFKVAGGGR